MKIEQIDSVERNGEMHSSEKKEAVWNQHKISTFQKIREEELVRLTHERPSKAMDRQQYYNYRAREEQIKYELSFRQFFLDLLSGSMVEACVHYGHALNHIKRRNEYEKKLYAVWLQRVGAQENPPTPDILFINEGIRSKLLV